MGLFIVCSTMPGFAPLCGGSYSIHRRSRTLLSERESEGGVSDGTEHKDSTV